MVNEILGALAGLSVGCVGYLVATLKATKREVERNGVLHDKEARIKELIQKCNEHSNAKKVIQQDYDQLKQDFQQLADEHNQLKETYAPLAALNPFERQAVGAVTNQSILDEWMNGEIKEGQ